VRGAGLPLATFPLPRPGHPATPGRGNSEQLCFFRKFFLRYSWAQEPVGMPPGPATFKRNLFDSRPLFRLSAAVPGGGRRYQVCAANLTAGRQEAGWKWGSASIRLRTQTIFLMAAVRATLCGLFLARSR